METHKAFYLSHVEVQRSSHLMQTVDALSAQSVSGSATLEALCGGFYDFITGT